MANVLRIVIGLAGLTAAAWSASRTLRRRRRDGQAASFRDTFAILGVTAGGIALTLLI